MTVDRPRATLGTGRHELRATAAQSRILAYLAGRKSPATVGEIAAAVLLTPGVTARHLRDLRAAGSAWFAGYAPRRWGVGEAPTAPTKPRLPPGETAALIVAWLEEHDAPATVMEIAAGVGMAEYAARHHMRMLDSAGKVFAVGRVTEGRRRSGCGRLLWLPGPVPEGWTP